MIGIFDLAAMFEESFGYRTTAFDFPKKENENQYADLGSPLFKKDAWGREYYMPVKIGDYDLPFPVVSIKRSRLVVDTPMMERSGSVQELISSEDWQITVRGLIISNDGYFPEQQLKDLAAFEKITESLRMMCALTDIFLEGEQKVNLRYMELPEVIGSKGQRPYLMEFRSDLELDLLVISEEVVDGKQSLSNIA